MRVLTAAQMREADRRTIAEIGIPSLVLMENAGRQVVAALEAHFEHLPAMQIAVLCGRGNNGGDALVAARALHERGVDVRVFLLAREVDVRDDARVNLEALRHVGVDVVEVSGAEAWELHGRQVVDADLIVDGLVGTGLREALTGLYETVIADVNASPVPVVSIDLPSGLAADSSAVIGPAFEAALTVTLGAPKLPLVLPPAESFAGTLVVADIGIPSSVIESVEGPWLEVLTSDSMRPLVRPRPRDAHKGDFGRVLVVAGSTGKTGAAVLAGLAALRSGAGLVTVAAPAPCVPTIAAGAAEYMTLALPETPDGVLSAEAADRILNTPCDVIALGPGLGRAGDVRRLVLAVLDCARTPLILDADALMVLAGDTGALPGRNGVDVIITPHPGEMAALVGLSVEAVQARRLEVAREFAATHRVHVVLKGHRTIVATPGGRTFINVTGNPGMATAGAGDVLTGVIAAWMAQLRDAEAASTLAVYLHGLAGDLAEADEGEVGLIAGDILSRLGDAVLELTARRRPSGNRA